LKTSDGAYKLFEHYTSLEKALRAIYPNYPWSHTRFIRNLWRDPSNHKIILEKVGTKLGVKTVRKLKISAHLIVI